MGIVAKYKFNQNTYADFIPTFNSEFTNYTVTDEIDTDGYTIRIIESDSLPTLMRFGQVYVDGESGATDKSLSLLEVYEIDLSTVADITSLFRRCENLTIIHCQLNCNFNIVTNMSYMFSNCSSLASLDVSNFNTEKVTDMSGMFYDCSSLTSLDVSNFNTKKVTSMTNMLRGCSSLTSLDVSNFNTEKVANMHSMFYNCSSLISLNVSNFNTEKVTNMSHMFCGCSLLSSLDVSNFNTKNVTSIEQAFNGCNNLTSLDVSNFNTSQAENLSYLFQGCSKLTTINVSNWNTDKVTNMSAIFNRCSSLTSLNVSNFNTSQVTNMDYMFASCSSLTSLDVSNFNTENVTNMQYMFDNCSSLTSLDVSSFNMENVTNTENMFTNCFNITDIGTIYCNSDTINKISDLITTNTSIYYMDAKLEDLTKKSNITYKEYKMNILESDEEINLRRIGDVYDELNLETGELTQRIGGFNVSPIEKWNVSTELENTIQFVNDGFSALNNASPRTGCLGDIIPYGSEFIGTDDKEQFFVGDDLSVRILKSKLNGVLTPEKFIEWLSSVDFNITYQLATPVIKTINLKGKPSINWQGDTYLHLENNTLYPQLDCEVESINYYEIPKLKANTLYTLRYVGEPTQCIFGGLTYRTENNMILTSGSSNNLLYFDKEVRKVVLIEGDVRDRNFDYFEGIESLGAVEIVTHKTNMPIFAKGGRK